MMQTVGINCPNCGAAIGDDASVCPYCGSRVFVTSFNDIYALPIGKLDAYVEAYSTMRTAKPDMPQAHHAAGLCYLKLHMYDEAYAVFSEEIRCNYNGSEAYFYAAVALLHGNKPFLLPRSVIDQVESLLKSAFAAETRGIYLYFLAYVRYDYFERKYLNVSPNYREYLQRASARGVAQEDVRYLYTLLGTERPKCL